jgi:hypothetical protein
MSLLRELSGHPEWVGLIKKAQRERPTVPSWDSNQDNTDEWKHKSAMQEGFDLCLQIFAPLVNKEK